VSIYTKNLLKLTSRLQEKEKELADLLAPLNYLASPRGFPSTLLRTGSFGYAQDRRNPAVPRKCGCPGPVAFVKSY